MLNTGSHSCHDKTIEGHDKTIEGDSHHKEGEGDNVGRVATKDVPLRNRSFCNGQKTKCDG